MANFKRAFNEGLRASTDAERCKVEIFAVFDDFARQVRDASGGVLEVVRSRLLKPKDSDLAPLEDTEETTEHDDLVAVVAGAEGEAVRSVVLLEYELAPLGYPVALTYADNDVLCEDKLSLEQEMETVLSTPSTGTRLRRLMEPPPLAKQPGASATQRGPTKTKRVAAGNRKARSG